jgi:TonB-dependent SusC/RagA subfamily outer membrane receptor
MKKKYYILLAFLSVAMFAIPGNVQAQKEKTITVTSTVIDEAGKPVANAEVFGGDSFAKTDGQGQFSISMETDAKLVVEAKGYESITLSINEAKSKVTLKPSVFLYNEKQKVNVAFRKIDAGDVVGSVSTVNTKEVNGYDNSIWGDDVLTGRTLGVLGSNNIRGLGIGINVSDITNSGLNSGNALYIVDGLPRDINSLRLAEIESVTVLKDANASVLYGSAAINGVILITTRRGEAFKKKSDTTTTSLSLVPGIGA